MTRLSGAIQGAITHAVTEQIAVAARPALPAVSAEQALGAPCLAVDRGASQR
jgi:hypothetical protein